VICFGGQSRSVRPIALERPWPPAATVPALQPDQIHLWCACLQAPAAASQQLLPLLSAAERERARRFRFRRHRRRFILTRGILRHLLGRYLGIAPQHLQLAQGRNGKPYLSGAGPTELQFNLAHAGQWALYAFASGNQPLGIDLERDRPLPQAEQLARRFFAPRERDALRALPASERSRAFLQAWTRKEAYLKAIGTGLAGSLDRVEVPVGPARLLQQRDSGCSGAARWWLCDLVPAPGYVAALAGWGDGWRLQQWQLPLQTLRIEPPIDARH